MPEDHIERVGNKLKRSERALRKRPVTQTRKPAGGTSDSPDGLPMIGGDPSSGPGLYGREYPPGFIWEWPANPGWWAAQFVIYPNAAEILGVDQISPYCLVFDDGWDEEEMPGEVYLAQAWNCEEGSVQNDAQAIKEALRITVLAVAEALNDLDAWRGGEIADLGAFLGDLTSRIEALESEVFG